jgi:hypothetical protein
MIPERQQKVKAHDHTYMGTPDALTWGRTDEETDISDEVQ